MSPAIHGGIAHAAIGQRSPSSDRGPAMRGGTGPIAVLSAHFVSDLHITAPDDPRARLFLAYLRSLRGGQNLSHLFLLGDVFDLWVADHSWFIERYAAIIGEIRRLRDEGTEIHYFEGNHDLYLERYWAHALHLQVHEGPLYVELGGLAVRLEHGDQMDPNDHGYRFLRWFLRTPPIRFLASHLPQTMVVGLGHRASASSRTYTSGTKAISDVDAVRTIRTHAARAYQERPFDIIISGHVHTRDDHRPNAGGGSYRSVNLGTWLDAPCFFHIGADGNRLYDLALDASQQLIIREHSTGPETDEASHNSSDRSRTPGTATRTEIRRHCAFQPAGSSR